jgi:hypothetical protein
MSWARLDDRWHDHPKVIAAGLDGAGLFAMCLTWAHSARRTSHTPGVVPDAVISRFAGRKAAALAKRLHDVGLFDDRTDTGWPIHDFDDYLPRYDTEQAKAAGARGGRARAENRKQTAKQTASEPLSDPAADPVAKPSTRASARRNPDPVPTEELRSSADAAAPGTELPLDEPEGMHAGVLVAEWIEQCRRRPPERIIGQMSREFRLLLEEDFDPDDIRAGLATWMSKDVAPSVLPSMVNQIVNAKPKAAPIAPTQAAAQPSSGWRFMHETAPTKDVA